MMQPRPPARTRSSTNSRTASTADQRKKLGASSATLKKSERQNRREQRKLDEEAVVAATSAALLDSVVPSKLIDSAAQFVLSTAPRIFGFHARHMTSIRHPFFTMLCSESASESSNPHGEEGDSDAGDNNNNNHDSNKNRQGGRTHSKTTRGGRTTTTTTTTASRREGGLHRGGTNNISTAHVSAVDAALKAHRRSWQSLPEYLTDRFSDISSAYPIEVERWKQTAYMFDTVLLEDDLTRRRKDILESVHVVRALEACWTSWGGTTDSGIDFDTYREEHLRLYQTLMGIDTEFDRSFMMTVFEPSIQKDWSIDREVANSNSAVRKLQLAMNSNNSLAEPGSSPSPSRNSEDGASQKRGSSRGSNRKEKDRDLAPSYPSFASSVNTNNHINNNKKDGESGSAKYQVVYEVPFRRFCAAMLELADNWTRLRIGEQTSQVFARFLMQVVLSPAKKRKEQQPQQQESTAGSPTSGANADPQSQFSSLIAKRQKQESPSGQSDDANSNTTNSNTSSKDALRRFATPITTSSIPPSMAYASILMEKQKKQKLKEKEKEKHQKNASGVLGGNFEVISASINNNNEENSQNFSDDIPRVRPVSASSEHSSSQNTADRRTEYEWKAICNSLMKRAFVHRGGPVIRMIPSEVPGHPPTYAALPKTRCEKEFEEESGINQIEEVVSANEV